MIASGRTPTRCLRDLAAKELGQRTGGLEAIALEMHEPRATGPASSAKAGADPSLDVVPQLGLQLPLIPAVRAPAVADRLFASRGPGAGPGLECDAGGVDGD